MEEIDITYSGEEMDVGFNVNYLIDAISVISKESLLFEVGSGIKPSTIRETEDDDYLCIVMPLKI
jgi:DNA polymerase III subunit beta